MDLAARVCLLIWVTSLAGKEQSQARDRPTKHSSLKDALPFKHEACLSFWWKTNANRPPDPKRELTPCVTSCTLPPPHSEGLGLNSWGSCWGVWCNAPKVGKGFVFFSRLPMVHLRGTGEKLISKRGTNQNGPLRCKTLNFSPHRAWHFSCRSHRPFVHPG